VKNTKQSNQPVPNLPRPGICFAGKNARSRINHRKSDMFAVVSNDRV
jgi:hypothetical protein